MRKRNFKLIRKTLEWPHRIKGNSQAEILSGISPESYRYFRIYGNGTDDAATGVGDYDTVLGAYSIPVHFHGKNLMGGEEFMAVHSALNISKVAPAILSGFYTTTPLPEYNGTVIIGPKHVRFKEKTPYTLALHLKYFTSATKRPVGMRFQYSDGTYDALSIASSSREFKICFTSDSTKNLVAIASHNETAGNVRINLAGFGFYEGTYTEYTDAHEAYTGYRTELKLSTPLKKIEHASDCFDIINGVVTRKISTVKIDGLSGIKATDAEGIFEIELPKPMRPGSKIVSPFAALEEGSESGIAASADGEKILFKASGDIVSDADMQSYLNENPFYVSYVLCNCEYEAAESYTLITFDKGVTCEPLCSVAPSKIIAEYV